MTPLAPLAACLALSVGMLTLAAICKAIAWRRNRRRRCGLLSLEGRRP